MPVLKNPEKKRLGIYVKLPPVVVDFLRENKELGSQSNLIINALKRQHKELKKRMKKV